MTLVAFKNHYIKSSLISYHMVMVITKLTSHNNPYRKYSTLYITI